MRVFRRCLAIPAGAQVRVSDRTEDQMSKPEFIGGDVNAVLRLVRSLSDDGNTQLSILTVALVTACASCEVPRNHALRIIGEAFDDQRELVPIDDRRAFAS